MCSSGEMILRKFYALILKGDEDLEEQFTVKVTNVSITAGNFEL